MRLRHLEVFHAVMLTGSIRGSVSGGLINVAGSSSTVSCGMQTHR